MITSYLSLGIVVNGTSLFFVFKGDLYELQKVNTFWRPLKNWNSPSGQDLRDHDHIVNVNNESIFVVSIGKHLLEFNIPTSKWINHGSPGQSVLCSAPCGAAMWNDSIFVPCSDNNLYRRYKTTNNTWLWENMGAPTPRLFAPTGFADESYPVAMHDGRLFIIDKRRNLTELRQDSNNNWHWSNHSKPPSLFYRASVRSILGAILGIVAGIIIGALIGGIPGAIIGGIVGGIAGYTIGHYSNGGKTRINRIGATMMPSRKLFTVCQDGYLNERYINGTNWVWSRHDKIKNTSVPVAMNDGKLFLSLIYSSLSTSLQQRYYNNGSWVSYNHGNLINGGVKQIIVSGPSEATQNPDQIFVLTYFAVSNNPKYYISSVNWNGTSWVWENHVDLP